MKNNLKLIVAVAAPILSSISANAAEFPTASLTVVVRDENGQPVPNARVGLGGTMRGRPEETARGLTSNDGSFSARIATNGEVGIGVRKDGYYETVGLSHNFRNLKGSLENAFASGHWEPQDLSITAILKKIANPIPMFARRLEAKIPVDGLAISLDLLIGDWLAPYGRGKTGDFVFRADRSIKNDREYFGTLNMSFSNPNDGLLPFPAIAHVGSRLRSLHSAPEGDYVHTKVWEQSRGSRSRLNDRDEATNYFFRVRTMTDSTGKVTSALYGKIYGDVRWHIGSKAPQSGIGFTYYLNPIPNDRNIEFDPKRNLFTNLKDEEKVTEP